MTIHRRMLWLGAGCMTVAAFSLGLSHWASLVSVNSVPATAFVVPSTPEQLALIEKEDAEMARILAGGKHHKPLRMVVDFPGIQDPPLKLAAHSNLPDSTRVIGIEVNGEPCAIVLGAMVDPARHIINLVLNHQPVSVTYCDLADCVRVLTDERKAAIPLRVGGLDMDDQMVLLFENQRYAQLSMKLPLQDFPFVRTNLGAWMILHPASLVIGGNTLNDSGSSTTEVNDN